MPPLAECVFAIVGFANAYQSMIMLVHTHAHTHRIKSHYTHFVCLANSNTIIIDWKAVCSFLSSIYHIIQFAFLFYFTLLYMEIKL